MTDVEKVTATLEALKATAYSLHSEDIAIAVVDALRPSFSEAIIENGEVGFRCDQGHLHVIYKQSFRSCYPLVLGLFAEHGPMTTAELAKHEDSPTIRKAPSELLKFGLLRRSGARGGFTVYQITSHGQKALTGEERVYAWVRDDERLPDELRYGPRVILSELKGEHPGTNKHAHVEHSVPFPLTA